MEKFTRFTKVTAFHTFVYLFIAIIPDCVLGQELKHLATLEKFLADDVVGIVYFDFEKLDVAALAKFATDVNALEPDEIEAMNEGIIATQQELDRFADHGITRIYILLRTADIQHFGSSFIVPIQQEALAKNAEKEIIEFAKLQFGSSGPLGDWHVNALEIRDGVLMATTTESQMKTLKTTEPSRRSITAGMEAIGTGTAGILLFGDKDSRRVIEELLPNLPAPFEAITGEMIAKEIEWLGLRVNLNEVVEFELSAESSNPAAAETIASSARTGLNMLKLLGPVREVIPDDEIQFVFDCLAPQVDGSRVTISTEKMTDDKDRIMGMLRKQIGEMRGYAVASHDFNNMRMIALAMLNYESAHGHFPPQHTTDENGKPLLSWRVELLPFLEQNELYEKFHHDEPWDSEHNIKLLAEMPPVYGRQGESFAERGEGLTTMQVPAGEGRMFHMGTETTFRDIVDGSSNTFLIVRVAKKHAVEWTKPADWEVDLDDPFAMITEEGRTQFQAALADGSVQEIAINPDLKETLQKLIQHDDGEIVDMSVIR